MIDLKTKQAFWVEQLPIFKEKYWIPGHLDLLEFDMIGGCFEVAEGVKTELSEEDILEIYHRVNSGWAMWKKAVTFMQEKAKAQAVPETHLLIHKKPNIDIAVWLLCQKDIGDNLSQAEYFYEEFIEQLIKSESGAEG